MAFFKSNNKLSKSAKLAITVSKRFANPKQELAIQTTAGVIREAVAGKGGFNRKAKFVAKRIKKVPYNKQAWGTLGFQGFHTPKERREQSTKVTKQVMKAEAYTSKINSKKWRKAAGDR